MAVHGQVGTFGSFFYNTSFQKCNLLVRPDGLLNFTKEFVELLAALKLVSFNVVQVCVHFTFAIGGFDDSQPHLWILQLFDFSHYSYRLVCESVWLDQSLDFKHG